MPEHDDILFTRHDARKRIQDGEMEGIIRVKKNKRNKTKRRKIKDNEERQKKGTRKEIHD